MAKKKAEEVVELVGAEAVEETPKPKKAAAKAAPSQASVIAAQARAVILKATGQKPLAPSYSTMAHVPSGSTIINLLIGGSPAKDGNGCVCPGYPRRRISEVYGPESSGKTTAALAAIADCQRAGGLAMFLDFEHALAHGYAKTIGVDFDPDKLLYYQPDTMEEGLKMLYVGIKAGVDLIVVDSVAAMIPKAELEKKIDDNAKIGALAKAMSEILPKMTVWLSKPLENAPDHPGTAVILLNQTRASISTGGHGGGDNENTSGGKALKFYAYLRLRISRIRSDFLEKKDPFTGKTKRIPIGNLVGVKIVKNKADGNQGHGGEVFIRYGYGLDDNMSLIEAGVVRHIIKKTGNTLTFGNISAPSKEKFRQALLSNPKAVEGIKEKIYASILDSVVKTVEISDEDKILSDMSGALGDQDTFDAEDSDVEEAEGEEDAAVYEGSEDDGSGDEDDEEEE